MNTIERRFGPLVANWKHVSEALRGGPARLAPASLSVEEPGTDGGPAGWYPDPAARQDLRFFDGKQWTDQRTRILPTDAVRRSGLTAQVGS